MSNLNESLRWQPSYDYSRKQAVPKLKALDGFAAKYKATLQGGLEHIRSGMPCYNPARDIVSVPYRYYFEIANQYYHTIHHELIHSTGLVGRLARPGIYLQSQIPVEEMTAEIGACLLDKITGITNEQQLEQSNRYIQYWLSHCGSIYDLDQADFLAKAAVDFILKS